jgi:hypothetical protein
LMALIGIFIVWQLTAFFRKAKQPPALVPVAQGD